MSPAIAWTFVILGFVLPLVHVAMAPGLSPAPTNPADEGARATCPFSPRMGWIVIVLFLGPIGWLMFLASRRRKSGTNQPTGPSTDSNNSPDGDQS